MENIKNNNILFLMVARGGSKGVPKKNLEKIDGTSLIGLRANTALSDNFFSRCIISTDDEEIAAEAMRHRIEVPFIRPSYLAEDNSSSVDVVKHVVDWIEKEENLSYDAIFLAEPSSPFCRPEDIRRAIKIYNNISPDLVVSVVKNKVHSIHMGELFSGGDFSHVSTRLASLPTGNRQQHKDQYIMNGCVYLFGWDYFTKEGGIFTNNGKTIGFEMPAEYSIEIDEKIELDIARFYADSGKINISLFTSSKGVSGGY
jgi:CMP-N,N'-diacetyllegionaminic acid synthase